MKMKREKWLEWAMELQGLAQGAPVSYTHLDVYKRQVYMVPMNFGYEYKEEYLVFYFHGAKSGRKYDIIAAVSYTHLAGYQKPVRVQGAFVSDKEVQAVVEYLKTNIGAVSYTHLYDTINGYLIDCLDRIPSEDEKCTVQFEGYLFEVLSVDNNTIRKVRIVKKDKE